MNLIVITNLGRTLKLDTDSIPVQGRSGVGVQLKLRTIPKMKKNEYIVEITEDDEDVCN